MGAVSRFKERRTSSSLEAPFPAGITGAQVEVNDGRDGQERQDIARQRHAAAEKAEAAGIKVVMNRCPKIEYGRLSSEIGWIGVNSRTLSSKKAPLLGKGVQRMSLNRTSVAGGTTLAADHAAERAVQDAAAGTKT